MGCSNSKGATSAAAVVPTSGPKSVNPAEAQNNASVLPAKYQNDITAEYTLGKILGKGQFGTTRLAVHKETEQKFACKSISKRRLIKKQDREDVQGEVEIMHHLSGHPNVVKLINVYEDKRNVHIVMELCSGGELFDRIVKRGHYSERNAAQIIRSIVEVVAHCHSMGVVHRDLKPENFLLSDGGTASELKATDFGLSSFFKSDQLFNDIVGSAYYVAPEVLKKAYGSECDIWSCGVMLYILLCGVPPFFGDTEAAIFRSVVKGQLDFDSPPWPRISAEAKDCVKRMLEKDVHKRATADQILKHPWMKENGCASDQPMTNEIQTRLKNFNDMGKLKKQTLMMIASYMAPDEVEGLKKQFQSMDADNSGTITVAELKVALSKMGNSRLPQSEIDAMVSMTDMNMSGAIDYAEFLAATMHASKFAKEEHFQRAFAEFDSDGSGTITKDELAKALVKLGTEDIADIEEMLATVDLNGDGNIDYNEFAAMLSPTAEPVRRRNKIKF